VFEEKLVSVVPSVRQYNWQRKYDVYAFIHFEGSRVAPTIAEIGVRLWLWLDWSDTNRNDIYKKAFGLYEKWGMAGVKIDFTDCDDQDMANWYEKIAQPAAEHP
jgi:hypothetical protein